MPNNEVDEMSPDNPEQALIFIHQKPLTEIHNTSIFYHETTGNYLHTV
jgi:hypothetical protein